jgi:hypothetical protein
MPLILDPDQVCEVVLRTDQKKPPEKQPTFIFKTLTGRDWLKIVELSGQASSGEDSVRLIFDAPDGAEIQFNLDVLDELLTPTECNELLDALMGQRPTPAEKKTSESQSLSNTAEPVNPAGE